MRIEFTFGIDRDGHGKYHVRSERWSGSTDTWGSIAMRASSGQDGPPGQRRADGHGHGGVGGRLGATRGPGGVGEALPAPDQGATRDASRRGGRRPMASP